MLNCLFRANANASGIYLSTVYDSKYNPIYIKKSASTFQAILRLKGEIKGVTWYSRVSNENLVSSLVDLPGYYSVKFRFITGVKANFRDGYWINRDYIKNALDRYCEIWSSLPADGMVIHGDYSIDNLIFSESRVTIIDWEHFSEVEIPIGFHALNLIYEQLYMFLRRKELTQGVISHANSMIRKLYDCGCLHETYSYRPLQSAQNYILNNLDIWGAQMSKLPILKISPSKAKELDALIKLH